MPVYCRTSKRCVKSLRGDFAMQVSVIIPAYNREKTIVKCLDSVINQTYRPFEVIVVDDASNDNTVKLVEEYPSDIVKIIKCSNNGGAQVARNIGIKAASGDWIAFQDSDDIWLPDKLKKQKEAIEKSNFEVCAGGGICKKGDEEKYIFINGENGNVYKDILKLKTYILYPTLLIKKSLLEKIGYLDEKVEAYQELDTAIRLSKENHFAYINAPLFIYNIHEGETISKNKDKGLKGIQYLFIKYKDEIFRLNGTKGLAVWYKRIADNCKKWSMLYYKYLCLYIIFEVR